MGNELTYTKNDDGTISVKETSSNDGTVETREIRYAKEADLLAVKGSSQAAKERAETAEAASKAAEESSSKHKEEIKTANKSLDETHQKQLEAEAKVDKLEEQVKAGVGSKEELDKVKTELEAAKTSGEGLTNKALDYRRQIIAATYGIPVDTLGEKTMEQLDFYEEALKAVIATKAAGNFAVGGGGGGGTPVTSLDRAKATIAAAMERRNQGFNKD